MTASLRQHLFGRSSTARTPWPSAWDEPSASGDFLGRRRSQRMLAATWTLYSRQMLATGFDAQRYSAVDGTGHRIHAQR